MKTAFAAALALTLSVSLAGGCGTSGVGAGEGATATVGGQVVADAAPQAGAEGAGPELPPPSALETRTGLQVARIASTASGGLVDARFKVLDAAKASALLANPANMPMLIVDDKPPLMAPHHALKSARFVPGEMLVLLYPNVRGVVQPGTAVTVALGATHLGPVTAQ